MDVPVKKERNLFLPRHGLIPCGKTPFPQIFGIINLTPDSFSDGGKYSSIECAVKEACFLLDNGAFAIDAGGESTRRGAEEISVDEEKKRLIPFIKALRRARPQAVISADTRKSRVAASAMEAGADIINDVSGLQFDPDMGKTVAETSAGLILMHSRGTPQTMKEERFLLYNDIVKDVAHFLNQTAEKAVEKGIREESILLDPGLGFAKTPEQDWELCRRAEELRLLTSYPLFYAPSRKSFLKKITAGELPAGRDAATFGILGKLTLAGVEFIRIHDVKNASLFLRSFSCALKK